MSKWKRTTIAELARGIRGVSYNPDDLKLIADNSDSILLRANNIQNDRLILDDIQILPKQFVTKRQFAQNGDIIVCMSNGSKLLVGKNAIIYNKNNGDYTVGAFCSLFRPNTLLNASFVFYIFQSEAYQKAIDILLSGSTINNLTNKSIENIALYIPVLTTEQCKIAEILTTVDEAIDNSRTLIEKHINIKTGMMQDLLLNSNWEYGFFSDLVDINPPTYKTIHFSKEVDFIPMQDINENGVWDIRETRLAKNCMKGFTVFTENDVLFAKITPCMENGKGCIVKGLRYGIGFGSTEFHVLRAKANADPRFVYQWSIFPYLREKAIAFMIGSAGQQRVSVDFFQKFRIKIPPKTEQQFISDQLTAVDKKIQVEHDYLAKLLDIKKGLMKDLLTNTISVDSLL